jgi:hypothetical protein
MFAPTLAVKNLNALLKKWMQLIEMLWKNVEHDKTLKGFFGEIHFEMLKYFIA